VEIKLLAREKVRERARAVPVENVKSGTIATIIRLHTLPPIPPHRYEHIIQVEVSRVAYILLLFSEPL